MKSSNIKCCTGVCGTCTHNHTLASSHMHTLIGSQLFLPSLPTPKNPLLKTSEHCVLTRPIKNSPSCHMTAKISCLTAHSSKILADVLQLSSPNVTVGCTERQRLNDDLQMTLPFQEWAQNDIVLVITKDDHLIHIHIPSETTPTSCFGTL